jgi:hypothetical protein
MKHEVAEFLVDNSDGTISLREGYSGRGMYGKETTAIVAENINDILNAAGMAFEALVREALDLDSENEKTATAILRQTQEIQGELSEIRYDSYGRGMIFY